MGNALDLAAIRERCEKATPGPWIRSVHGWNVLSKGGEGPAVSERRPYPEWMGLAYDAIPDAEFIAHSREDIPALLDEVERLRGIVREWDDWDAQIERTAPTAQAVNRG